MTVASKARSGWTPPLRSVAAACIVMGVLGYGLLAETLSARRYQPPQKAADVTLRLAVRDKRLLQALEGIAVESIAVEGVAIATGEASASAPGSAAEGQQQLQPTGAASQQCRGPREGELVPHLQSVRVWHSADDRFPDSVTLVTQLSLERLRMLRNQCAVWPDPIAAVVYVPTVQGSIVATQYRSLRGKALALAGERLDSFVREMQRQACSLDLELVTQDFANEAEAGLYPINAARNRALLLAHTEVVLLLDADFVPTATMLAEYKTLQGYAALLRQLRQPGALVLPAFEVTKNVTDGKALALAAAQRGKAFAAGEFLQGRLAQFQQRQFGKGHRPTNYSQWVAAEEAYPIHYQKDYEPYVLVSRQFAPWYDERFVGFGRNKIQYIRHLAGLNFSFSVHPSAFVVHVPHRHSLTHAVTRTTEHWAKMQELYTTVEKSIGRHKYLPVVERQEWCSQ